MKVHYLVLCKAIVIVSVHGLDLCPDGSYILGRGLSPDDQKAATDEHNRFRAMLVDGTVAGQPRAKYMKTMTYDEELGQKCVPISDQCWMNHIEVIDERWTCVGQNIYIAWHSLFIPDQNWTAALASWFYECNDFQYPDIAVDGREVGHYTQVAWADSDTVGCDFILYIDPNKPSTPFCSMYTCNYGPCGNYNNLPPYELCDDSQTDETSSQANSCACDGPPSEYTHSSNEYHYTSESEHHRHDSSHHSQTTTYTSTNNGQGQAAAGTLIQNILNNIWGKGRF